LRPNGLLHTACAASASGQWAKSIGPADGQRRQNGNQAETLSRKGRQIEVSHPTQEATEAHWDGRWWILLAAVLWSTSGFFAKSPLFAAWPADQRGVMMGFWRAVFATLVMLPFVRRPRWDRRLVPMGLSFAAMNATFLTSMVLTTAANAIWLQSTAPLWVFLAGHLWFGESWQRRDLIPLSFGLLGVSTILAFELPHGGSGWGIGWGLASGVFYAGVVLCLRWLRGENGAWLVAVNHFAAALLLGPYVLSMTPWPTAEQFAMLAAFGTFQMALPYLVLAHGLRTVPGPEASVITLCEPVLTPIWVFVAWRDEIPAWWTLLGGGMILVGLLVRYLGPPPAKKDMG
jgi:drug/metabolite transporter (DMT)-like permease